ncbi:MAG: PBP1A family penicillin-binding protein [SAR324 cluster bacterium]|nr:PBP1A family penicillin-binding protein [SAR324 cluster bacterium]
MPLAPQKTPRNPPILKILALASGALFLVFLVLFFIFKSSVITEFNRNQRSQNNNTIFYDIDRQPFHVIKGEEDRKYIPLKRISRNLQMSVVAVEDARFFKHFGFDPIRLVGATLRLLKPGASLHGASTITQQLVKLSLLTPERTFTRKLKELFMAIAMEVEFSKAEILEFYLNKVYLGHRNYGVENAALNYFHKSAQDLTLAEAAFIAGLIKKPEGYSPYSNIKGARTRQILVLKRLRTIGWITQERYKAALNERIQIRRRKHADLKMAPYFTTHVLSVLKERYSRDDIYGGGLRVFTTLHRGRQKTLKKVIDERFKKPKSFSQVGAVSMDPETGFVSALVGGIDFDISEFNRVTQAKRQPGSSFKPILYTTALTRGVKPNDSFVDEPIKYSRGGFSETQEYYEPANFSGNYLGPITMAQALKRSNNVVSVQILKQIGVPALVRTAKRFGIDIPDDKGLCLALGCGEVTLLQLATAYGVFANDGQMNLPVFILKVTDSTGKVLEEYRPQKSIPVITPGQAFQMNRMLQNVVNAGTGRGAKIDQVAGGKTGTTDSFRDAWFMGFTSELVTGIWVGNDDNSPMNHETGGRTPARLWKAYMTAIDRNKDNAFSTNIEFEEYLICDASGRLATSWCEETSWYPLRPEAAPQEECTLHDQPVTEVHICRVSKKLATQYCPTEKVGKQRLLGGEQITEECDVHGPFGNFEESQKPMNGASFQATEPQPTLQPVARPAAAAPNNEPEAFEPLAEPPNLEPDFGE